MQVSAFAAITGSIAPGYPLPELPGGLNIMRGAVTGLKRIGGDGINMQIPARVQPGNSGGRS